MFIYQYFIMAFIIHLLLSVGLTAFGHSKYAIGEVPWQLPLVTALPLPLLTWALCVLLFVDAVTDSAEECGVDACGMAAMAATILAALTLVAYGAGVILAFATRGLMGRSKR